MRYFVTLFIPLLFLGVLYGYIFAEKPIQPQYKPYFYVTPNDLNEYEVVMDTTLKVYEYNKQVFETSDTFQLIAFVMAGYDSLGVWIYKDSCSHFETDSLHAAKALYQMIEGAECVQNRWGENVIAFY